MDQKSYLDTPLWNSALPVRERVGWLLSEMTPDEKLKFLATTTTALPRLGIRPFHIGGEAAHGIEARHDQDGKNEPETTTSFPQPIGMSASWDERLMEKAGKKVGTEGRALWNRHKTGGLSRWAPTVDMERDPRWGRTEEAYGEDPFLTGKMASAYVRGIQGTDGEHLRMAASLKHFYANNVEDGRVWKSSSIDPRNKYEYYLEPFRRVVREGHVEAMMTAYNEINGIPAILNHEVQDVVKRDWGLRGHVVCDGGDMSQTVDFHHYYGTHAETIAEGLKAGIDCFTDNAALVEAAAREAYELGLIDLTDIDRALANSFGTKIRLGIYDAEVINPYDRAGEEDVNTKEAEALSMRLSQEGCVLLKNENGFLPLDKKDGLAVIGPVGDAWYHDWYGGDPAVKETLLDGITDLLGRKVPFADGLPGIRLCAGEGYVGLDADNRLTVTQDVEGAEVFSLNDWGFGSSTLWAQSAKRFVTAGEDGMLYAQKREAFGWFVKESFELRREKDGSVKLLTWNKTETGVDGQGRLRAADRTESFHPVKFTVETVQDGLEKARRAARSADKVILALGCNPVINSKEEIDRTDLVLPPFQEELARAVMMENPNTVLVLLTNYPYAVNWEQENIPAILQSATGSQRMGGAVAGLLFGDANPSGRLPMTWYKSVADLPEMDDYDIIQGKRTYRYFDREALYPFGYGLSYTTFAYGGFTAEVRDFASVQVRFTVTNTGVLPGSEVAQVYVKPPADSRVKRPLKQLVGFERVGDLQPGESRQVIMEIPLSELTYYDVVSRSLIVEEGSYTFFAGGSSAHEAVCAPVRVKGRKAGTRRPDIWTDADHYDSYENIYLHRAMAGLTCAVVKDTGRRARLVYRDFDLAKAGSELLVNLKCDTQGSLTVLADGEEIGRLEADKQERFTDMILPLRRENAEQRGCAVLELFLEGDIRVSRFCFAKHLAEQWP